MFSLLCVALGLAFLTMISTLTISLYVMRESQRANRSLLQSLISLNRELTNLAAAKDLETFRNLQAISQMSTNQNQEMTTSAFSEANIIPMDDQSMAKRLADHYKAIGIDPSQAYAPTDNPLDDFGGLGAIL